MADSVPASAATAGTGVAPVGPVAPDRREPTRTDLVAVVLAAGAGTRLRPLTLLRPKALCPVANRPLVDLAIDSVAATGAAVAVNVHHGRELLEPHLVERGDVQVSVEPDRALGTAGAIGQLRGWIDGRGALVVNADAWARPDLATFVADWDGERVRVLVAASDAFGPRSAVVASLLPWSEATRLRPVPSGLWELCWRDRVAAGTVETVRYDGPFIDCGTPSTYLLANRWAAALATGDSAATEPGAAMVRGERIGAAIGRAGRGSVVHPSAVVLPGASVVSSVVGAGVTIGGQVRDSVVWSGNEVLAGEELVGAVRAGTHMTVLVR